MATMRADQYTTNKETDLYIDGLAEDELDEGNPFKQISGVAAIADPNDAAVAALLSRKEPEETEEKGAASTPSEEDEPTTPKTDHSPPKGTDGVGKSATEQPNDGLAQNLSQALQEAARQESIPAETERRGSTNKRPRGRLMNAVSEDVDDLDPETQHLVKRARRDSRSLLVQPGDDTAEEKAKMRANLIQRGVIVEEEDDAKTSDGEEAAAPDAAGDSADRPVVVKPVPLMDRPNGKSPMYRASMPRDEGDDYSDMEAKGDDDYDPGNYVRFEDDEDDMGEVDEKDKTAVDERLTIDEEELVPGPDEGVPATR